MRIAPFSAEQDPHYNMKIAVAQINTTVGDFEGNLKKITGRIDWAAGAGAELVIFPEMATTGYPPRDLLERPYFVHKNLEYLKRIAGHCKKVAAVVGFVSINKSNTGKGLFNSAAFLFKGKVDFVQHKMLLPTYDVFDEARHFEPGKTRGVHKFGGVRMGLTICEDLWNAVSFRGRRLYKYNPVAALVKDKAQIIINISASPFNIGKGKIRESLLTKAARKHKVPIIYTNLVGGNDELVFDGRSIVVNKKGEIVHEGKLFCEDSFIVDTDELISDTKRNVLTTVEELWQALALGLSDYVKKCDFKRVVIGLSGGIDSAVVAALAAQALGPKNVTGVAMPSPYSSRESIDDARALAENLKISFQAIPITDVYNSYKSLFPVMEGIDTALENIQARIRGNILMAISNRTGAMVLSTGNKSELAVGYCTLYGDMAGGLAVISDVPKTMVYDLAKYVNRRGEVIPRSCLTKPPSAELKPNQKDTDTLPAYEKLDRILKLYIEDFLSHDAIIKKGFERSMVEDIVARVNRNEYKRRQAPPGLKVTSKAFGAGRRCPIACKAF